MKVRRIGDIMNESEVREAISELYTRVGNLETEAKLGTQASQMILDEIKKINERFDKHDTQEMRKYDNIMNELSKLKRWYFMVVGGGVILGTLYSLGIIKFTF